MKDGPPFVSIKVIENGLRDEDFSQEYKRLLKTKIQYDTFMKRRAISTSSRWEKSCYLADCNSECCCCWWGCLKVVCGPCRTKMQPNMYQVLDLVMGEELGKRSEKQIENINLNFEKLMGTYDPTKNSEHGNQEIANKIKEAYETLITPDRRVKHVNEYEKNSFCCFWNYYYCHLGISCVACKSFFYSLEELEVGKSKRCCCFFDCCHHLHNFLYSLCSDCCCSQPAQNNENENQSESKREIKRNIQWNRIFMLVISILIFFSGILVTVLTFAIDISDNLADGFLSGFGGGLVGAGLWGFSESIERESISNFRLAFGFGFFIGAVTETTSWLISKLLDLNENPYEIEELIVGTITGAVAGCLICFGRTFEICKLRRKACTIKLGFIEVLCDPFLGASLGAIVGYGSGALKTTLTQDTGIDVLIVISWLRSKFLRFNRTIVKVILTIILKLFKKICKCGSCLEDPTEQSSGRVHSINMCC